MKNDSSKNIIDITDVELMPGKPAACLGNGNHGFECLCDECDYFLLCFPEFNSKNKKFNETKIGKDVAFSADLNYNEIVS